MVPKRLSVSLYAYNRPLLAERGLAEPGPDATLTELITIARQVAVPGAGDTAIYGIYDPQLPFDLLLHELRAAGIDLDLSATGAPPPLRDERYADALALVQALIAEGVILRDPPNAGALVNDRRSYRLIDRGQVAIWPADYVFAPPARRCTSRRVTHAPRRAGAGSPP
jgi:ABC-type glycerol-3-phosphate transport system substrate-binding protein